MRLPRKCPFCGCEDLRDIAITQDQAGKWVWIPEPEQVVAGIECNSCYASAPRRAWDEMSYEVVATSGLTEAFNDMKPQEPEQ